MLIVHVLSFGVNASLQCIWLFLNGDAGRRSPRDRGDTPPIFKRMAAIIKVALVAEEAVAIGLVNRKERRKNYGLIA